METIIITAYITGAIVFGATLYSLREMLADELDLKMDALGITMLAMCWQMIIPLSLGFTIYDHIKEKANDR